MVRRYVTAANVVFMACLLILSAALVASEVIEADSAREKEPLSENVEEGKKTEQQEPDISFEEPIDEEEGEKPASPFGQTEADEREDAVPGYIELSTGLKVPGKIYTTRGREIKVFDLDAKRYREIPLPAIGCIVAEIEWEREEQEWYYAQPGDATKTYTGVSYPLRKYVYTVTLLKEEQIKGHITFGVPIYVQGEKDEKPTRFILHDRHKGEKGQTLKDLVYVNEVRFGEEAYKLAVEEALKKAEDAEEQEKSDLDEDKKSTDGEAAGKGPPGKSEQNLQDK